MLVTASLGDSFGDASASSRATDWFRHPMPKKVDANERWPAVPGTPASLRVSCDGSTFYRTGNLARLTGLPLVVKPEHTRLC
jgi:hypothetical protein